MGVDVTAWCVIGKRFDSKEDAIEYLKNAEIDFDEDDELTGSEGWECNAEDGYAHCPDYILGWWLDSSSSAEEEIRNASTYTAKFRQLFNEEPSFIVTEHWW